MGLIPEREPKGRREHFWELVKLVGRKPQYGWLAGKPVGVECHWVDRCQGCARDLTDGRLECRYCLAQMPTRFRAYVPVWDENGQRRLLIMGERYWSDAKKIGLLQPLRMVKTATKGEAINCHVCPAFDVTPPMLPHERVAQDIAPVLLRLWGNEELRDALASLEVERMALAPEAPAKPPRRAGSRKAASLSSTAEGDGTPAVGPMYDAAMSRPVGSYGNLRRAITEGIGDAEKNGHVPRKPK